ncbi:hypothetical protein [Kitasatospora sp. NPDC097643]|uniref:hypothetical protein n=1 Tax=Kitasatospora sp. NPDC097643 TaxID=3157230 RepID=UPI00331CE565
MTISALDGLRRTGRSRSAPPDSSSVPQHATGRPESRWWLIAEGAVGAAVAMFTTWLARFVHVDPMVRVGQVSGLASLQLFLLVLMAATLAVAIPAMRRWRLLPVQFASAVFAGLATGITAAGISIALKGTSWPLNGQAGDSVTLQNWAYQLAHGGAMDPTYPPLFPHLLSWYTQLFTDGDPGHALKMLGLAFTALLGPVAYLAWRLLLPPLWALGIGVTSAIPLMDPYKPYTSVVLVGLLPVLAKLLQLIQRSQLLSRREAVLLGVAVGGVLGVLFLLYSGWFVWSAAGLILLGLVLLVRLRRLHGNRALGVAVLLLGSTGATFLLVSGVYLYRLLTSAGAAVDRYCYFDVYTEPTYFAMWGSDVPGSLAYGTWPAPGEIGGVSLFTVLLLAGAGAALALGPRNSVVLAIAAAAASAFAMRYWYASHMFKNQAVMLYPRTNAQLLYCFLALTGFAFFLGLDRYRNRRLKTGPAAAIRTPRGAVVGALCALGLLFGMAGSSTANRYMPEDPRHRSGFGSFAWEAQTLRGLDGSCSPYAPEELCHDAQKPAASVEAAERRDAENTRRAETEPAPAKVTCQDRNPFPLPNTRHAGANRLSVTVAALLAG